MYSFLICKYCNTSGKESFSFLNLKTGDKLKCSAEEYEKLHAILVKKEKFLTVNVAKKTDL